MKIEKLDSFKQREWLRQHIPHRICAAQTWLEMKGDWEMLPHPKWENKDRDKFHIWCICRSVDEGRKAAMRWLIEFIGVAKENKDDGKPKRPNYLKKDKWIEHFDPSVMFDLKAPNASKLAGVWQGCTQSSMHSTYDTKHPEVGEKELAKALPIVITHLEKHLYEPNGFSLLEIVRDQEERKHRIWQNNEA